MGTQSGKQIKRPKEQKKAATKVEIKRPKEQSKETDVSGGVQGIVEGAALLGEYIREDQSKEYLVDGATLTCTSCTKNVVLIAIDGEVFEYYAKKGEVEGTLADKSKIYGRLTVTENGKANICGQQYATVADSQKGKNIPYFGNCCRLPVNKMEREKLREIHNEAGLEKRKEGSCKYLMNLSKQWETYELGKGALTFGNETSGEISRIAMTSTLFCTHGGFIYPVSSGQAVTNTREDFFKKFEELNNDTQQAVNFATNIAEAYRKDRINTAKKEMAKMLAGLIMDKVKEEAKAFIPQEVSNDVVVAVMEILSINYPVLNKTIEENAKSNLNVLTNTSELCVSGQYIENQALWTTVKYGNGSTMDYTGCGIIASYNAMSALGENVSEQTMVDLISRYEQDGAVLYGMFGTSPYQIEKCFEEKGYDVISTRSKEEAVVNDIGDNSDTVIATVYNNQDNVMDQLHTVSITKDSNGKFSIHNTGAKKDGKYVAKDNNGVGYDTLHDAICDVSGGNSMNISVIGISNPTNNTP